MDDLHLTLSRAYCWEQGTFGLLVSDDGKFQCNTIEQPWAKRSVIFTEPVSATFASCVPEGEYLVKRVTRPKHGNTFILINESLGIYEEPHDGARDNCLIHEGNVVTNVEGCIAVGNKLGVLMLDGGKWAVLESNTMPSGALRRLHAYIGERQQFRLTIQTNAPFRGSP